MKTYISITIVALVTGIISLLVKGVLPFSWLSYFSEMYPFFFGVAVLGGLFLLVLKTPAHSLARTGLYWITVAGIAAGCLILCILGLFVNPMNWKDYTDYTSFDGILSPLSNIIIVLVSVALVVFMLRELRKIRQSK